MMSRFRMQNFTVIGQGVPEISVRTHTHTHTHTHTNHFSNIEYSHGRTFYKKNFFCVYSSTSLLWFLSSGVRPLGSRMKKIRALPLLGCPQPYWPLHRRGVASGFSRVKHFCTLLLSLCNWRFKISTLSQCLKIAQNVAFELINFGIFHQFLTC